MAEKIKFEIIANNKVIGYEEFTESSGWFHVLYAEPENERVCHSGTYEGIGSTTRRAVT